MEIMKIRLHSINFVYVCYSYGKMYTNTQKLLMINFDVITRMKIVHLTKENEFKYFSDFRFSFSILSNNIYYIFIDIPFPVYIYIQHNHNITNVLQTNQMKHCFHKINIFVCP